MEEGNRGAIVRVTKAAWQALKTKEDTISQRKSVTSNANKGMGMTALETMERNKALLTP